MHLELAATRAAREACKAIDRAKAVLVQAPGIDEKAPYILLCKTEMDQGKRVAEIT